MFRQVLGEDRSTLRCSGPEEISSAAQCLLGVNTLGKKAFPFEYLGGVWGVGVGREKRQPDYKTVKSTQTKALVFHSYLTK